MPNAADLTLDEIAAGGMFEGPERRWEVCEIEPDERMELLGNRHERRAAAARARHFNARRAAAAKRREAQ